MKEVKWNCAPAQVDLPITSAQEYCLSMCESNRALQTRIEWFEGSRQDGEGRRGDGERGDEALSIPMAYSY